MVSNLNDTIVPTTLSKRHFSIREILIFCRIENLDYKSNFIPGVSYLNQQVHHEVSLNTSFKNASFQEFTCSLSKFTCLEAHSAS